MITASALPRLAICPASALLPHEDYSTQDAVDGAARHAEREALVLSGRVDELPEAVAALVRPGDTVAAEQGVAYSPSRDAGRLIASAGRAYRVRGDEIPGTADLVISGNGRLVVVDWKGHRDNGSREQVMFYALALARALHYSAVTVAVHYESGRLVVTEVDDLVLDAFAAELRGIVARAADPAAPTKVSQHCRFCPAFSACPEQRALAAQSAGEALWQRVEATSLSDDGVAADFYVLTQRVATLLKRMQAKVHARASEAPIPLGGGRVFGPRETRGSDKLDADVVYEIARTRYGQAFADAVVERDTSKAAIKRAIKHLSLPASAEREIIDATRAAGGITNKPGVRIEEHTPAQPGDSEAA